jgi:hypothetical protein
MAEAAEALADDEGDEDEDLETAEATDVEAGEAVDATDVEAGEAVDATDATGVGEAQPEAVDVPEEPAEEPAEV